MPQGVQYSVKGDAGSHTVCVEAPDPNLQPALKRAEVHFPSAAPFILWVSCLSQEAAAFYFGCHAASLGGAIDSYIYRNRATDSYIYSYIISNLWCRVSA